MQYESKWYVYILRCADQTLYTGITNRLQQRLRAHNAGKGAKYTKGRRPVHLLYWETCTDKSAALKREAAIKKMKRAEKLLLCTSAEEK
ncbi:MAG: endonuclease [Clostridiales bacterium]|nr:MAG: endonuclease [Clostridiales bacterium]